MLHIKEIKRVDEEQAGRMCSCEAENMLSSVPIMQLYSPGDEGQCFHPEMKILPLFYTFSLTKTQKDDIQFFFCSSCSCVLYRRTELILGFYLHLYCIIIIFNLFFIKWSSDAHFTQVDMILWGLNKKSITYFG